MNDEKNTIHDIQYAHRQKLINRWTIPTGARVLEIGCGQGDTTEALAYAVGGTGYVHAIDIAPSNYGAPVTLGEARAQLLRSEIGAWVRIDFEVDMFSDNIPFEPDSFDYIVFSHCSWYFKNPDELYRMFVKVSAYGKKLCFAEWDIRPYIPEQLAHHHAVMIQAQCGCYKENTLSNIRTIFSSNELIALAERAGWIIETAEVVYSPELHNAEWEIDMAIHDYPAEIQLSSVIPVKMKQLLQAQISLLTEIWESSTIRPLSVFVFTAIKA